MEIVDANVVLRYLLKDHKQFYKKSRQILEKRRVYLPLEVTAEIVYVLEKVYEVPRIKITEALTRLLDYANISSADSDVLHAALNIYSSDNIDFVDTLLVGYNRIHQHQIHTFDKKVKKLCEPG